MRKIYLHIGCGKTGSSALQLWLNNNAKAFAKAGIHYPLFGSPWLDDYAITSGNGVEVVNAINRGDIGVLLKAIRDEANGDILISSETFQNIADDDLYRLRDLCAELGLSPVIVAYIRDVYDMLYSSYLQLIKRHLYSQSFREYALTMQDLQQFNVVNKWSAVFEQVRVIHYDSVKDSLDNSFCDAIGIDPGRIPRMSKMKVNRSMTLEEAELLRHINRAYVNNFDTADQALCRIVSDAFILSEPETPTPILFDERVFEHVSNVFKAEVERVNNRYFGGIKVLSIFNQTGKFIETEVPVVGKSMAMAIDTLISLIETFGFSRGSVMRRRNGNTERLDIADPRVVDVIREEAVRRERDSLDEAYLLMSAARVLRPNGPFIIKKLNEYKSRIDSVQGANDAEGAVEPGRVDCRSTAKA